MQYLALGKLFIQKVVFIILSKKFPRVLAGEFFFKLDSKKQIPKVKKNKNMKKIIFTLTINKKLQTGLEAAEILRTVGYEISADRGVSRVLVNVEVDPEKSLELLGVDFTKKWNGGCYNQLSSEEIQELKLHPDVKDKIFSERGIALAPYNFGKTDFNYY